MCAAPVIEGDGGIEIGGAAIVRREPSWWAELLDRHEYEPRYGHREVEPSPVSGVWEVVAGGRAGTLDLNAAWEASGRLAIPVPATYVRLRYGTPSRQYLFAHDNVSEICILTSATPTITLPAGRAFTATIEPAALTATDPGTQTITGDWIGAAECYLVDLADSDNLTLGERHVGRLIGQHADLPVYAFRSAATVGSGSTYITIINNEGDHYEFITTIIGITNLFYYVINNVTNVTNVFTWICDGDNCGWWDWCDCVWHPLRWYCTGDGCRPAYDPPAVFAGGPYLTEAECAAACAALQWWCVDGAGGPECVAALSEPVGAVGGPYATESACALVCGTDWWCVDEDAAAPWWCVETPVSPGPGIDECEACPDCAAGAWDLSVSEISDSRFAGLEGDWLISWDPISNRESPLCVWGTSPYSDPQFPHWAVVFKQGAWRLLGQLADGSVVEFVLIGEFDCCGPNTFEFAVAYLPGGSTSIWTAPATLTITPATACDCEGDVTVECVQSQTEPVNSVSGPHATEAACVAICGVDPQWWCVDDATCELSVLEPPGTTSGPHASEAACAAVCGFGGPIITDCCPLGLAGILNVNIADGDCAGDYPITWNAIGMFWELNTAAAFGSCMTGGLERSLMRLVCDLDDTFTLTIASPLAVVRTSLTIDCATPLITFPSFDLSGCDCGAAAGVTVGPVP